SKRKKARQDAGPVLHFLRLLDFPPRGHLPPAPRASEGPMAMACFRLVTFLPDPPERNVPRLRSCMAFSTFCAALSPYLRPLLRLRLLLRAFFFAAMRPPSGKTSSITG